MKWLDAAPPPVEEVHERLREIIPEALDPKGWARREMAAKVVYVMLYGQAVEGEDRWLRPTAVTDMTDEQAAETAAATRREWLDTTQSPRRPAEIAGRWYQENTREPIRDETIRRLIELGAVIERPGLPTTSPKPRYALSKSFAQLFSTELVEDELDRLITAWRRSHLRRSDLARVELNRRGVGTTDHPLVHLPTGETRRLVAGPSADLTIAVVEELAPTFLRQPGVILISQSAKKLTYEDRDLARSIGFSIDPAALLPDLLLVDLGGEELTFVFVECVITDGEIDRRRLEQLEDLARRGGIRPESCAFVTAFRDRAEPVFRKVSSSLAWGSFAWFASEPRQLLVLRRGGSERMRSLREIGSA